MNRPLLATLATFAFALAALGAPALASADSLSDCQAAVKAKLDQKAPKNKNFKFAAKTKSVANAKKDREEISGRGTYKGKGGEHKEMGWTCVVKGGKVSNVELQLEQ